MVDLSVSHLSVVAAARNSVSKSSADSDAGDVELFGGGDLAKLLQAASFQLAGAFFGDSEAMTNFFQCLRFVAGAKAESEQQDFSLARVEPVENPHQDVVLRLIFTLGLELVAAFVGGELEDLVGSGFESVVQRVLGRD